MTLPPSKCTSDTRPPNPPDGWIIYETDTKSLLISQNGQWITNLETYRITLEELHKLMRLAIGYGHAHKGHFTSLDINGMINSIARERADQ